MAEPDYLRELATIVGVQPLYDDMEGRRREASDAALVRVLQALGVQVTGREDGRRAWEAARQEAWDRFLEPVIPVWDGGTREVGLHLPTDAAEGEAAFDLHLEDGGRRSWEFDLRGLPTTDLATLDLAVKAVALPRGLPPGYHRLAVEVDGTREETLLVSAPSRVYAAPEHPKRWSWGVFLPLYALHTQRNWGAGDLRDLEALMDWVGSLGGRMVGTLPLLATFLGAPIHDPSPYAPASRLFWNELYVDVERIPELAGCPEARAFLDAEETREEIEALRASPLVRYSRLARLKRAALERLADCFFSERPPDRTEAFEAFRSAHPEVEAYARFRAATEAFGRGWPAWPEPQRSGELTETDVDTAAVRYHLYAQWVAAEQVDALVRGARGAARAMYLDLPLGVHSDSFDAWREQEAFVRTVSVGAPPDVFFTEGQDWGFPPLHPERIREDGYRYLRNVLHHHMSHADYLRIDHVMGLHRLWWIPHGLPPREGAYVRYNAEELYAILSLESHRNRCAVVGENLGTVPPYVNQAMARHGLQGMYVVQYELRPGDRPLPEIPTEAVASLNTHDMPTFAGFWEGRDIDDRVEMGLLDTAGARRERERRARLREGLVGFLRREGLLGGEGSPAAVLRACLTYLAASPARLLLLNLEDLWLEPSPQNVPGTVDRPNWRRKARYRLDRLRHDDEIAEDLRLIDTRREGG